MIVLGIGKKDKRIIFILAISFAFIASMFFFAFSFSVQYDSDKLVCYIMMTMFLVLMIIFLIIFILQIMKKDDVVLYDLKNNFIIVNCYKKTYQLKFESIENIKVKNKGLGSIGPLIFPVTYKYGRLKFVLNDGNKITTPVISDVENVYEKINDIRYDTK